MREVHLHLSDVLFFRNRLLQPFINFIGKLSAMLNHLVHCAVLQELAVLIAIYAVIRVFTPVGVRSEDLLCERHSAALAKFLFHTIFIIRFDAAKVLLSGDIHYEKTDIILNICFHAN